jgi:hypothetical protein
MSLPATDAVAMLSSIPEWPVIRRLATQGAARANAVGKRGKRLIDYLRGFTL